MDFFRKRRGVVILRTWVIYGIILGIVAGVGAILLYESIKLSTHLFLGEIVGYIPPCPLSEGSVNPSLPSNRLLIPVATTLGGLISGLLVYKLAPETEGHGTDAAIDAFHNGRAVRKRVPIIKMIASAITIGSGGSAGREGPMAQIASGIGSFLGERFKLNRHQRRILMAVGVGAGIGSIFKAPFGGALFGAEVLYKRDFEVEVIVPAIIASVIGYVIFGAWTGYEPVFGMVGLQHEFVKPINLLFYAILGVVCGLGGILYVKTFYATKSLFSTMKIPNYLKPAIGGLGVGLLGMAFPHVLGVGYGWLQLAMTERLALLPLYVIIALAIAKIFATALSIGSGGSGGVFAPGLFVGGMLGLALWKVFKMMFPDVFTCSMAAFVIVGMMALFGGVAKAPISVIIMVTEMTSSYLLLVPSMLATTISYLVTRENTIYESQVEDRASSPAHYPEYHIPVLRGIYVREAMSRDVVTIKPYDSIEDAMKLMGQKRVKGVLVVDESGDLCGIVTLEDVLKIPPSERSNQPVESIMSEDLITAFEDETLHDAFEKMVHHGISHLPVVDADNPKKVVGMLTINDIMRAYDEAMALVVGVSPQESE